MFVLCESDNSGWDYSEQKEVRDVIRKPYKIPNKKENWAKLFPRDYLWTLGKGVLYGHSERSGVLYGNHIYTVGPYEKGDDMQYKVVVVDAVKDWGTNFEKAAAELSRQVNEEIAHGWEPIGGVNVGRTQSTEKPYLLQAMVKR